MRDNPRLQFTDAERADPELEKPIRKAEKAADRADQADAKIPKKTVKKKERVVDPGTGKVTTRLKLCAEHGTNLAGASPVTGIYRQV